MGHRFTKGFIEEAGFDPKYLLEHRDKLILDSIAPANLIYTDETHSLKNLLKENKVTFENETGTDPDKYLKKAKGLVVEQYNKLLPNAKSLSEETGQTLTEANEDLKTKRITQDDVFIVWFSKTLGNWKALVATNVVDDFLYFEVTYNGEKKETYVDVYEKIKNVAIHDLD